MPRIFLCHASEDKSQVRDVYQRLRDIEGFEPWLDEEDLLPGQVWEREIPRALKASEFILIFLSQHSVAKRGYVQREMKLALDALQEMPEDMIHTIPVRLDACEVPEQFRRYHYANLFDARGFDRLVAAIRAGLAQRQPPASAVPAPAAVETRRVFAPTIMNDIGIEFVLISAGTFTMGSPASDEEAYDDERPGHHVQISQPFYLGKYAVTQAQWEAVMRSNPSGFTGHPNRPVEQVSWDEVQAYIQRLNAKEGGTAYRLPTEAEWEYACRAGSTTVYSFGDDPEQLDAYAWYEANSEGETHPVGQLKPNAWGLYDMYGNVWEWVQDWYDGEYYTGSPRRDPQGPLSGSDRVLRGGGWYGDAGGCRSACRRSLAPGGRARGLGFRLLRTAP